MKPYLFIAMVFISSIFKISGFAQSQISLGKIIVGQPSYLWFPNCKIITADDSRSQYILDISDVLENQTVVDLKTRGKFGVQNDIYIRGIGFEHSVVMIDGMSINDPHSGHFNFDIPLTVYDYNKIKIIPGAVAILGSNALGGVINIETSEIKEKKFRLRTVWGQKQLNITTISYAQPGENFNFRLSLDRKSSASYRPETDFDTSTVFFKFQFQNKPLSPDVIIGWMNKNFGADSFYSQAYNREEEHTRTFFALLTFQLSQNIKPQIFYRRHYDRFILDRENPDFYTNLHHTHTYTFRIPVSLEFKNSFWDFGLELSRDDIKSTNLGKHLRTRFSGYLCISRLFGDKFLGNISLRMDKYNTHKIEFSPGVYLQYDICLGSSIYFLTQRSFRIPSFTELYYSSPANKGNPDLNPESGINFEIGLKNENDKYLWGLSLFRMFGYDVVDWGRQSLNEPWQAGNISSLDIRGGEMWLEYKNLKFAYSYLDGDYKSEYKFYKYVANYLRHNFNVRYRRKLFNFDISVDFSYRKPKRLDGFFDLDVGITKKLNVYSIFFLRIDNFFNARQEEILGVTLPGRWLSLGMEFNF